MTTGTPGIGHTLQLQAQNSPESRNLWQSCKNPCKPYENPAKKYESVLKNLHPGPRLCQNSHRHTNVVFVEILIVIVARAVIAVTIQLQVDSTQVPALEPQQENTLNPTSQPKALDKVSQQILHNFLINTKLLGGKEQLLCCFAMLYVWRLGRSSRPL